MIMYLGMEADLIMLADEREIAASNERLWAKGSNDPETIAMHEENAAECAELAEVYRRMAKKARDLYEQFG
jgi:hypothetical protein